MNQYNISICAEFTVITQVKYKKRGILRAPENSFGRGTENMTREILKYVESQLCLLSAV